jgi:RimJ/RimL family protein N-acetyltransferase
MASKLWPLFALRIRTPRLELRPPDDEDLAGLAELAAEGIHDPGAMPFMIPWSDRQTPLLEWGVLQYHWRTRAAWTPDRWDLSLAVLEDGVLVGSQGMHAERFSAVRTVTTGSWLGRRHQGRGIGKEMRASVLHFAFAGLGAQEAYSGAWHDNHASLAVSRALGYEPNGESLGVRRDTADRMIDLRLTRAAWESSRRDDIEVDGLEPCLSFFGAAEGPAPDGNQGLNPASSD